MRSEQLYHYLSQLILTYTKLYHRGISLDISLQESYPCISQNNSSIPTYTWISRDKSQFGLSLAIQVQVGIWQGVVFSDALAAGSGSLMFQVTYSNSAWGFPSSTVQVGWIHVSSCSYLRGPNVKVTVGMCYTSIPIYVINNLYYTTSKLSIESVILHITIQVIELKYHQKVYGM